jgi:hypothetical protein
MRVEADEPRPVSADGTSITDTYWIITDFTSSAFVWESNYTITRVR